MPETVTPRLAWRLAELAQATGLSLPFLRKEARAGNLPVVRRGTAVIVLDEDVRRYLRGDAATKNTNAQDQPEFAARV